MAKQINGRTAEEIKNALRWAAHNCNGMTCGECSFEATCRNCDESAIADDALALIERIESERDAALTKVPKWISVEERLPENRQHVYACAKDKFRFEGIYIDPVGFERYEIGEGWINENRNVTHWMPLPEVPKEGAHDI